ncbi:MAG: xanthine phosphoribosyltransferase [Clostridia bacterium]|nr:xanthine phosphoribosyltransferase [Clostridia bacterium]
MEALKKKILEEADILPGSILRVDGFLNHQIDVNLLSSCGREWYEIFKNNEVTKILTVEASGIAVACLTAQHFGVPVVYARKGKCSQLGDNVYSVKAVSYTHGKSYDVVMSKEYVGENDKILIIDDLLAGASDVKALITIAEQAGATVVGIGIAVEKVYQGGGNLLRELGYRVESLAKISSLDNGKIEFCD